MDIKHAHSIGWGDRAVALVVQAVGRLSYRLLLAGCAILSVQAGAMSAPSPGAPSVPGVSGSEEDARLRAWVISNVGRCFDLTERHEVSIENADILDQGTRVAADPCGVKIHEEGLSQPITARGRQSARVAGATLVDDETRVIVLPRDRIGDRPNQRIIDAFERISIGAQTCSVVRKRQSMNERVYFVSIEMMCIRGGEVIIYNMTERGHPPVYYNRMFRSPREHPNCVPTIFGSGYCQLSLEQERLRYVLAR